MSKSEGKEIKGIGKALILKRELRTKVYILYKNEQWGDVKN
jgi:hypothetical protein